MPGPGTAITPTSIPGVFPMDRFFNEQEARAHAKARKAWLEAERDALARRVVARHAVREVSQELTCDCGKRHLVRVTLSVSDGLDASENDVGFGGSDAGQSQDRALERQIENHGSRFEAAQAVFKMVHSGLRMLASGRRMVTAAADSINRFEDSPAGLILGLIILCLLALLPLALNEGGLR